MKCLRALTLLALWVASSLLVLPHAAVAGVSDPFTCSVCHKQLDQGKVVHKPVLNNGCLKCHEQFSYNHPLGKDSIGFIVERKKLCAHCHGNLVKKKFLHGPVGKGDCTACHRHHNGDFAKLLKSPVPTLCFGCHPQSHFTGAFGHPPVAKGECLSCHDAHQADVRMLLRQPGAKLCFSCHEEKKYDHGKSVHPPVAKGKCLDCHFVHASPYRKILKADFPDVPYRGFTGAQTWPLCFLCHNPELVTQVTTDKATNFRNGTRNLHAVHVNKPGKGRNCKICHNPHAADQERLINSKSPSFGTWNIPIKFSNNASGGRCSVGCHKTFYYDRLKAIAN